MNDSSLESRHVCTFYSIITPLAPLKYPIFENIMENGAFAPLEQMLNFQNIFKSIQNLGAPLVYQAQFMT